MSKSKAQKAKAEQAAKEELPDAYFVNAMVEESDRGCVLVACAYLEHVLEKMLHTYFMLNPETCPGAAHADYVQDVIKDVLSAKNSSALLHSGWSKATVALLVGLIEPYSYRIYNEIKRLRNRCGHRPRQVPIDDGAVATLFAMLKPSDADLVDQWDKMRAEYPYPTFWGPNQDCFSVSRKRFMAACVAIYIPWSFTEHQMHGLPFNYGPAPILSFTSPLQGVPPADPPPPEMPLTASEE